MLTAERECEHVIERFGPVAGFAHEAFEAAHEILHGGTRRDIAKKVAPEDPVFGQPGEPRFVTVVLFDVPVMIDGDQSER